MMVQLADAVTELEKRKDVSVVIVTGEKDFFCAGAVRVLC
jgi:enoyl-CoA hydratase/carnithine racemase